MSLQTDIPLLHGSWRIDRSRSSVKFFIRHLGVRTVGGTFSSFDGHLADDGRDLRLAGRVDVVSVDTGDQIRDRRLREEFFDAEHFPTMSFEAVTAVPVLQGTWRLDGNLTIRGTTRPFSLTVRPDVLDAWSVRLRAEGRLTRSQFGLEWDALRQAGRLLVADHVRVIADIVIAR